MHVVWKFTGDAILAFAGGALALFGVWLSNRQSVRNVQRQLDAEKQMRKDEEEAGKCALAAALLTEIDAFYGENLNPEERSKIEAAYRNAHSTGTLLFNAWTGTLFLIYAASASRLGCLEQDTVRAIVLFYGKASTFVEAVRAYEKAIHSPSAYDPFERENAKSHIGFAASSIGLLVEKARDCCNRLCAVAGIDPAGLQIAREFPELKAKYMRSGELDLEKVDLRGSGENAQTH